MAVLADELRPSWLLLAGETAGVLDGHGAVIPEINQDNRAEIADLLGGSHGADVTGGMVAKVDSMLSLVETHPHLTIRIFSGLTAGLVDRLLRQPETAAGTRIMAG